MNKTELVSSIAAKNLAKFKAGSELDSAIN